MFYEEGRCEICGKILVGRQNKSCSAKCRKKLRRKYYEKYYAEHKEIIRKSNLARFYLKHQSKQRFCQVCDTPIATAKEPRKLGKTKRIRRILSAKEQEDKQKVATSILSSILSYRLMVVWLKIRAAYSSLIFYINKIDSEYLLVHDLNFEFIFQSN